MISHRKGPKHTDTSIRTGENELEHLGMDLWEAYYEAKHQQGARTIVAQDIGMRGLRHERVEWEW